MALISCPDCERRISEKANTCIKCGFPLDEFTAVFSWGTLLTSISRFILALDGIAIGVVFFIRGITIQDYAKVSGTYLDILKSTESNVFLGAIFLVLGILLAISGFKNFSSHVVIHVAEKDYHVQMRDWQCFGLIVSTITLASDLLNHNFSYHYRYLASLVSSGFLATVLILFHIQLWSLALIVSAQFNKNTGIRRPTRSISILSIFASRFSRWFRSSKARTELVKLIVLWLFLAFIAYCIQSLTAQIPRTRQIVWFTNEQPLTPVRPLKNEPI